MTRDDRARFTFRLPVALYETLRVEAKTRGVSINSIILQILWDFVKNTEKGE